MQWKPCFISTNCVSLLFHQHRSCLPLASQDTESVDLEGHTGADGQRVVVDTILGWRLPLTDVEKADEQ